MREVVGLDLGRDSLVTVIFSVHISRVGKLAGRFSQQTSGPGGMVPLSGGVPGHMSALGNVRCGLSSILIQQELLTLVYIMQDLKVDATDAPGDIVRLVCYAIPLQVSITLPALKHQNQGQPSYSQSFG